MMQAVESYDEQKFDAFSVVFLLDAGRSLVIALR